MNSYLSLAACYDRLTENVAYDVRCAYIVDCVTRHGNGGKRLLDLACGTGNMSRLFAETYGFTVTGMDSSEDMLAQAALKNIANAIFVKGDMRAFTLPEKADICVCALDSLNHLESLQEVEQCFACVYQSLAENGIFIFDVNTIYKHQYILADRAFVFDEEDFFLAWDNDYLGNYKIGIFLDIFFKNGNVYERRSEEFIETAFETAALTQALEAYFDIIGIYDDVSENAPTESSERIYFVCKRK